MAFWAGMQVHGAAMRSGHGGHLLVQTALVDFYPKIGVLEDARKVFGEISEPDLVSWNALISGCSLNGFYQEAFELFKEMILSGLKPNGSNFVSLIPICVKLGATVLGFSLHVLALKYGVLAPQASAVSSLISMYSSFRDLSSALNLFELQEVKDLVSWNSMIAAYSQNGEPDKAFKIFCHMKFEGERPDFVTISSILSSCHLSSICYIELIHAMAIKDGLVNENAVIASFVSMYAKSNELQAAVLLFQSATEKNLLLFNSVISGYLLHGLPSLALSTFSDMIIRGVNPDSISLISTISACAASFDPRSGKSLHAYSIKNDFLSNINVMNALLAFYSDSNQLQCALKLFDIMQDRNLISWNTLICGWVDIGETHSAVTFFKQIGHENLKFDLITLISILPSFYKSENIALGKSFHALAIKTGFDSDTTLTNALISMYANCGFVDDSHVLFETLAFRSIVSWNALMTGYRKFKSSKQVMDLFHLMKEDGKKPNSVTLLNILSSCETQIGGRSIHGFALRNFDSLEITVHTSALCMYARFQNLEYCFRLFHTMDRKNVASWNTMMSIYPHGKHAQVLILFKEMLECRSRCGNNAQSGFCLFSTGSS
ncbi:pentatricopeptide repeat-containing protein At2g39620-like [Phalaenopsis equestris]|uniref:pentatricopeptide repeat-containing protein At2g39620-like n=1 Tax=Phalaenopsis equestris TaxID=78828 RepID=UPI0009E31350|nr:pentatricopeptide repeat-containing protein At2g39620-like [Phalaenopsis equestris]